MATQPKVNAMLICDTIVHDANTGKNSLIGIFENIISTDFPCLHQSMSLYVKLTDAEGEYNFTLELADPHNNVIGKGEVTTPLVIASQLVSQELTFNLPPLAFAEEGKYEFRLLADGELLETKTFRVMAASHDQRKGD